MRSTVFLLCLVGLYDDAVALALTFDRGLAVAVANMPEEDAALQRKLWLGIARHVIQHEYGADMNGQVGCLAKKQRVG